MECASHNLVVLGEESQILDIDLLQEIVDINLLESGMDLIGELLVV